MPILGNKSKYFQRAFTVFKRSVNNTVFAVCTLLLSSIAYAQTCNIAVASNFVSTANRLKETFEATHRHKVNISSGSSGQIFAQIKNGAPFDIFLSADTHRPAQLIEQGYAIRLDELSPQVYASGQLVLWTPRQQITLNELSFTNGSISRVAMANPKIAPYGEAAKHVFYDIISPAVNNNIKIVYGENIAQAMLFTATGNVDAGFIALSQVLNLPKTSQGSWWAIPKDRYRPILQQGVLLNRARTNPAALAFMSYLKSDTARALIAEMGYTLPMVRN